MGVGLRKSGIFGETLVLPAAGFLNIFELETQSPVGQCTAEAVVLLGARAHGSRTLQVRHFVHRSLYFKTTDSIPSHCLAFMLKTKKNAIHMLHSDVNERFGNRSSR